MVQRQTARFEMLRFAVPLGVAAVVLLVMPFALPKFLHVLVVPSLVLGALAAVLVPCVVGFFRDPVRVVPDNPDLIVSAADGVVVGVEEMDEPDFFLGPMIRVAVFLSVFDVHVNRVPCDGTVRSTIYRAGKFLDVRHPQASRLNECRSWWIDTNRGTVAVRQIAGLIARRIVAWAGDGDELKRGAHFGMIRFGSRTEVFLPLNCIVLVKVGDRVQGAATPIARWPDTMESA